MTVVYRPGKTEDLNGLKELAIRSWAQFQSKLTPENWLNLNNSLTDEQTFAALLDHSNSFVCTNNKNKIIGMAFLIPSGNPTDIYDKEWSYIRFVTVDPDFSGQGIGKTLTAMCINAARQNNEKTIALHTSEFMDAARHIYETLGFTILKEINQRLGKRYWLYKLDL